MKRLVDKYIFDQEMNAGKMIFLTGPRQVGKTTFAKEWLASQGYDYLYFNWDDPAVMKAYRRNPLYFKNILNESFKGAPLPLVFDEIHKQKNWRNILKGLYDSNKEKMNLLVTGSARLGLYRKSGDSLIGRYFAYQMFPLGLPEINEDFSKILRHDDIFTDGEALMNTLRAMDSPVETDSLESLLTFGGFPEPFFKNSTRFYNRWQREYQTLLVKEDIRDISRIGDLKGIQQLIEILPTKIGSPLSINSIKEDLGYHHATINNWLELLKELFLVFTIRPWHENIVRSIKKETKLYFFDWPAVPDQAARFENLTALSLLKMAARFTETGLGHFEIMHIRDKEKREVDFILIKNNKPVALFEAKESDTHISAIGKHFAKNLGIAYYQIVRHNAKIEAFPDRCYCIPADRFFLLTG